VYVTPPDPGQSVIDWQNQVKAWFTEQAGNIDQGCSTFFDRITPGTGCSLTSSDWLMLAGIGAAGLFVLGKVMR
jgi:hypothetical protein